MHGDDLNHNALPSFAHRIMRAVAGMIEGVTMNGATISGDRAEIGDIVMMTTIIRPAIRIGVMRTGAMIATVTRGGQRQTVK